MHLRSFVVDYGELMAACHDVLAVGAALLHGLIAPAMSRGIAV
jgi:hypothetical protein